LTSQNGLGIWSDDSESQLPEILECDALFSQLMSKV